MDAVFVLEALAPYAALMVALLLGVHMGRQSAPVVKGKVKAKASVKAEQSADSSTEPNENHIEQPLFCSNFISSPFTCCMNSGRRSDDSKMAARDGPHSHDRAPVNRNRPDFSGEWYLEETEGDLDTFLEEMGQSWFTRSAGKALQYGVGRVVVKCDHRGDDDVHFVKTLADPRYAESVIPVKVGNGSVSYRDDIGCVTAMSQWQGDVLAFNATLDESQLSVILRIFYNKDGKFVEEMQSCRGTKVSYIFGPQS